jgi:tetratricopeptide (TPR) repeat protein
VPLLPELAAGPIEPLPAWTLSPEQERRLLFNAVVRFVSNVAGPAGTLLVLDDLQWAGLDALDLLGTLVRGVPATPVAVIGAYRETEVQHGDALSVALADLAHAGLATHHALAPLSPEEAEQLLDSLLEGSASALRQRILQQAGGVPFFVVSCAQGLRLPGGEKAAVPWDVTQSVRQRVAALPAPAQAILGAAAVIGRVVSPVLLTAVADQPQSEVLATLSAACRARLLEEGERTYQFAHDVIREVVEAGLGAALRLVLHRKVAEALENGSVDPPLEPLAYHYARSDAPERAILYLERAGDHAQAQHAHAAAEAYYRELVERLDELGRQLDGARVREKLGLVLRTVARYDEALAVLEQAAKVHRASGDQNSLGRVTAQIGWVHADRGTPEEGVEHVQRLLDVLESSDRSPGVAALYGALGNLLWYRGRYGEQLAVTERASELARALGDDRLLVQAERTRGLALVVIGRVEEARSVLEEASRLAEVLGDLTSLCLALNNAGSVYCWRGDLETFGRYVGRTLDHAERLGDPGLIAFFTAKRGWVAFYGGDWDQSRTYIERAVAMSRRMAPSTFSMQPVADLGRLCLAEGADGDAVRYLEEARSWAERSGNLHLLRLTQAWLAERDLLVGHPEAAQARLLPLLDRPGLQELDVTTCLLPILAQAYLQHGDVGKAEEVVAQASARGHGANLRLALVDALRVQAMVASRQGHWSEAADALEEGISLARSMPYPYAEARLLYVNGQLHAQKGEQEPAREWLDTALAIFRHLGARKDAERVEQDLAALRR